MRIREAKVAIVAVALALAACSSSTEPGGEVSSDGLAVHLTVDSAAVAIGGYIAASLNIENTTSDSVTRIYPPGDFGPAVQVTDGSTTVLEPVYGITSFFGPYLVGGASYPLAFAPHESRTLRVSFSAVGAGRAVLMGCLTRGDASDALCSSVRVAVTTH